VPKGQACGAGGESAFVYVGPSAGSSNNIPSNRPDVHGARMLVNASETLCTALSKAQGAQSLRWSGYRPYGS
jgi:hypothetical protein